MTDSDIKDQGKVLGTLWDIKFDPLNYTICLCVCVCVKQRQSSTSSNNTSGDAFLRRRHFLLYLHRSQQTLRSCRMSSLASGYEKTIIKEAPADAPSPVQGKPVTVHCTGKSLFA